MLFGVLNGSKSVLCSQHGNRSNVVYVSFPTGSEIRKRGGEGKEILHAPAMLRFTVLLSALQAEQLQWGSFLPLSHYQAVCLSEYRFVFGRLLKEINVFLRQEYPLTLVILQTTGALARVACSWSNPQNNLLV